MRARIVEIDKNDIKDDGRLIQTFYLLYACFSEGVGAYPGHARMMQGFFATTAEKYHEINTILSRREITVYDLRPRMELICPVHDGEDYQSFQEGAKKYFRGHFSRNFFVTYRYRARVRASAAVANETEVEGEGGRAEAAP